MKAGIFIRYVLIVSAVVIAWLLSRQVSPALVTLVGLLIIFGSTIWLIASLIKKPENLKKNVRSWWRLFWDGFWGL